MRRLIQEFVALTADSVTLPEPIYEFGSLQVPGQEEAADLRPYFPNKQYIGADMRMGPGVDVILIEVPDEVGGYGAKGVGEIGCVATAGAVAAALHSFDGIRRFRLPMSDAPAAEALLPRSRRRA